MGATHLSPAAFVFESDPSFLNCSAVIVKIVVALTEPIMSAHAEDKDSLESLWLDSACLQISVPNS